MTVNELVAITRSDYLYDTLSPYKWSDMYLATLFTQAEREAAKRLGGIADKTTQTSDNVATGTATSTTTSKLVDTAAIFTSAMIGFTVYNSTDNTWATITALDSPTSVSLSANIMASGEVYAIGDASKALTRICVSSGVSAYTLSDKVIKIERCYLASLGKGYPLRQILEASYELSGTPSWYNEEKRLMTLIPTPDTALNSGTGKDTLNLEVYRLPLTDLSLTDSSEPEIDEEYHFPLIHYVCSKAFMKFDGQAVDTTESQWHEMEFTKVFGPPIGEDYMTKLRKMPTDFSLSSSNFGL